MGDPTLLTGLNRRIAARCAALNPGSLFTVLTKLKPPTATASALGSVLSRQEFPPLEHDDGSVRG